MLQVTPLRTLLVRDRAGVAGTAHLSAASGLVRIGRTLYVVADDENSLGVFDLANDVPGRLVRIFDGELPAAHDERKAAKADLEALLVLPGSAEHAHGALLALGSGSRHTRHRAALMPLDAAGRIEPPVRPVDLAALLMPLRTTFASLNIEGGFFAGGRLCLLQRGNRGTPVNACIGFEWGAVASWLQRPTGPAPAPVSITTFALGTIDDVPLGFTDGAALPDGGWVFCAAAEDTTDSVADGACAGSVVGVVNAAGAIECIERLSRLCKVEGVAVSERGDDLDLLLVTDADDRREPALLLRATLRRPAR